MALDPSTKEFTDVSQQFRFRCDHRPRAHPPGAQARTQTRDGTGQAAGEV